MFALHVFVAGSVRVCVKCHKDERQVGWHSGLTKRLMSAFDGLDVQPGIGQTTLVGEIRDQSHLYGVLDRVRGLGLDLMSVETNWDTPEPGDEESAR
jgi:hypothetical protein